MEYSVLKGDRDRTFGIFYLPALVEDPFDRLLQPFPVRLLPRQDDVPQSFGDGRGVGILRDHQTDACPCRVHYLRAFMVGIDAHFARLDMKERRRLCQLVVGWQRLDDPSVGMKKPLTW